MFKCVGYKNEHDLKTWRNKTVEVKQMTTEEKWSTLTDILKYIKGCETSKTTPTLEK